MERPGSTQASSGEVTENVTKKTAVIAAARRMIESLIAEGISRKKGHPEKLDRPLETGKTSFPGKGRFP
jgi:hypothetical protein